MKWFLLLVLAVLAPAAGTAQSSIAVEFAWGDEPLRLYRGSIIDETTVTISRLDLLVSNVALMDGETTSSAALEPASYLSAERPRAIALGTREAHGAHTLRFDVGLPPELDRADPAAAAPGSALDPLETNLHWSWAGGYIFIALEGNLTRTEKPAPEGFLFHLGHEHNRTTIELPVPPNTAGGAGLVLVVDAKAILANDAAGALYATSRQTHGAADDALGHEMKRRLSRAFRLERDTK